MFTTATQKYSTTMGIQKSASQLTPDVSSILNFVPVRIFWKDLNLRYVGCNQKFAEDAGLGSPEEIVGKTDYDLTWPENADGYRRDDEQVINSGISKTSYEEPQRRPDGTLSWLLTSKRTLEVDGNVVGVLGTYDDITKLYNNRLAIERKRRLEVVGEMATGIAHDMRNLLTPISVYGELLKDSNSEELLTDARRGLSMAVDHAQDFCEQLLEFATFKNSGDADCCPDETIAKIFPLLENIDNQQIKLGLQLEHEQKCRIRIGAKTLGRVLVNLVTNASQAMMPNGGSIMIRTSTVVPQAGHISEQHDSPCFMLTVTDTGGGISQENQASIFDPFFSGSKEIISSSGRTDKKTFGLGLSICRELISNAGGSIHVKSQVGRGTEFAVFLPLVR